MREADTPDDKESRIFTVHAVITVEQCVILNRDIGCAEEFNCIICASFDGVPLHYEVNRRIQHDTAATFGIVADCIVVNHTPWACIGREMNPITRFGNGVSADSMSATKVAAGSQAMRCLDQRFYLKLD